MSFDLNQYAGEGLDQLDQLTTMPLIKLLQDISDEVKPRHKDYVPGAESGKFLMTRDKSITDGPLEIIVLSTRTVYVEWKPRSAGGGIVGYHGKDIVTDPRYRKGTEDKLYAEFLGENELKYTTYWAVRFRRPGEEQWEDGVIAHSKTQLSTARDWNKAFQGLKHPDLPAGAKAPLFATVWEVGSYLDQSKAQGEFFGWTIRFKRFLRTNEDQDLLAEVAERSKEAREDLQSIQLSNGNGPQPALGQGDTPPQAPGPDDHNDEGIF